MAVKKRKKEDVSIEAMALASIDVRLAAIERRLTAIEGTYGASLPKIINSCITNRTPTITERILANILDLQLELRTYLKYHIDRLQQVANGRSRLSQEELDKLDEFLGHKGQPRMQGRG